MSLESISALRQLTQVREQGATNQNENLEKVQDSVQQVSTSEAQRTNELFLAKAKAEYEVSLSDATVKRIESQLAREKTSLFVTGLVTGMTVALAAVDMGMNLYKDFKGGQNLGDSGTKASNARAIDSDDANVTAVGNDFYASSKTGKKGSNDVIGADGKVDTEMAMKFGLINQDVNGKFSVTNDGRLYGLDVNEKSNEISYDPSKKSSNASNTGDNLSLNYETVFRATVGDKGTSAQYLSTAVITEDDLKLKAQQFGLDSTKIKSFDDLMKVNPKAAEELFNENARSVRIDEARGAASIFEKGIENALLNASPETKARLLKDKEDKDIGVGTAASEINKSINAIVDANEEAGTTSVKKGAKYIANALISFAQTVVPQFQAYLAAKDKVEKTEIELQAAIEKLAAANRKLAQINNIISTVGGDNLGSGNNIESTGLT